MSAIENVVFDIGGVLLNWNPQQLLAGLYADPSLRERIRLETLAHPDWLELDRGTLEEGECLERFTQRTGRPLAEMHALMAAVKQFLTPIPETWALTEELTAQGMKLYCLSNMMESVYQYIRPRHPWERFEGMVISAHVKMIKPARGIYEHLLTRFGLEANKTAFVDDMPINVEAARKVGLHAIVFQDADDCRRQLRALAARDFITNSCI